MGTGTRVLDWGVDHPVGRGTFGGRTLRRVRLAVDILGVHCAGSLFQSVLRDDLVWGAVGCHPKSSCDFSDTAEYKLREMLKHPRVKALGEIGLDYSGTYVHSNSEGKSEKHTAYIQQHNIKQEIHTIKFVGGGDKLFTSYSGANQLRQNGKFNPVQKGKGSPYSITECRVPELILVLGSQPAGDVSHKPGGRLPLLYARPAVTPATLKRATNSFAAW